MILIIDSNLEDGQKLATLGKLLLIINSSIKF